ncbi:MAG: 50S ribosomal protein L25 [Actinomycetota bacterium]
MEVKLKAEPREGKGKGAAHKLRSSGKVPGVLYGHGMDPVPLAVDARELSHVLHTDAGTNVLIDLQVDSENHLALAREIQHNHIRGEFLHVDFLAIRRDQKIVVDVPIRIVGESHGVKEGGVVEHHLWDLKIECLPGDVPEAIDADISPLGIGESLHVSDLRVPEGADVLTDLGESVVSVVVPQVLQVEEEVPAEAAEGEEVPEGEEAPAEGETAEGAPSAEATPSEEGGEGSGQ